MKKDVKFIIRPFKSGDEYSLFKHINNKKIADNTLNINYPYSLENARKWVMFNMAEDKKPNTSNINFVIEISDEVVGSIGFSNIKDNEAEISYWLSEDYWGKGIMTNAVERITKYGYEKLNLNKIYGYVFMFNHASMRVLEKIGYKKETISRKSCEKNGVKIDEVMYVQRKAQQNQQ